MAMTVLFLALAAVSSDEAEIRAVLTAQQAAWNRGDIPAFMQGYENSPEILFAGKNGVTRGYQQVLDNYRRRYPNREAMGTLKFTAISFEMLGSTHAKLVGKFELERNAADGGAASGYFTLIFRKIGGSWKIVHDHTS